MDHRNAEDKTIKGHMLKVHPLFKGIPPRTGTECHSPKDPPPGIGGARPSVSGTKGRPCGPACCGRRHTARLKTAPVAARGWFSSHANLDTGEAIVSPIIGPLDHVSAPFWGAAVPGLTTTTEG